MVVESLELDFNVSRLHDFVDLAILFATDELAMLVGELYLDTNLVVE